MKNKTITILFVLLGLSLSAHGDAKFEMIPFGPGTFTMGSSREGKVQVSVTKAFEMGKYEVTQQQWFDVIGENPSHFKTSEYCDNHTVVNGVEMCPDHPVENISWNDTEVFFRKLNERDGNTGCRVNSRAKGCWRLPTEAEWEYATRARTTTQYSFGGNRRYLGEYGWYDKNSGGQTHAVGMKKPNPKGLYDVHGNVREWTMDMYAKQLIGGKDPLQEKGEGTYVIRGGSFLSKPKELRSASRYSYWFGWNRDIGFRPVRSL